MNPELLQTMLSAFKGLLAERAEIYKEAKRLDAITREAELQTIEMHEKLQLYTALANSTGRWLVAAGVQWEVLKAEVPGVTRTYEEEEANQLFGREVTL